MSMICAWIVVVPIVRPNLLSVPKTGRTAGYMLELGVDTTVLLVYHRLSCAL